MSTFDTLQVTITCPYCGTVDNMTNRSMQIKLADFPDQRTIRLGDELSRTYISEHDNNYLNFSGKFEPTSFTFLELWICENCREMNQWILFHTVEEVWMEKTGLDESMNLEHKVNQLLNEQPEAEEFQKVCLEAKWANAGKTEETARRILSFLFKNSGPYFKGIVIGLRDILGLQITQDLLKDEYRKLKAE